MKQTAVEKMIQYFIEQKNNGCYQVCIHDLIAQLYQAKAMEKEQIVEAWNTGTYAYNNGEQYYNETFKSE